MKGIKTTINNQNSIIYQNKNNQYIKRIILPKTKHPTLNNFMAWIEFNNSYILKQAYHQLLELNPIFMQLCLNGEALTIDNYTYDEVSYNLTMINNSYIWLNIALSAQTDSQLNLLIKILLNYDPLIPLDLLAAIRNNPRELGELEQTFHNKLATLTQLKEDEQGFLALALEVTAWFENCYKIKSANYLWQLSQVCIPHSYLWQQTLTKIKYGTNYYGEAQLALANFTYDQLINLDINHNDYVGLVEKFITHAFNIPDDQESINLLNMLIFNLVGEDGSGLSWSDMHLKTTDDIPKIFTHTFATILLSLNRLQTENRCFKQQSHELIVKSYQSSNSSASIKTELDPLSLKDENDDTVKPKLKTAG